MDPAVARRRRGAPRSAFYGDVFGWTEGDNTGEAGNPLILIPGAFGQFVYLLPGDPGPRAPDPRPLRPAGRDARRDPGDRRQGQGMAGEGRAGHDHRREGARVRRAAWRLRAHQRVHRLPPADDGRAAAPRVDVVTVPPARSIPRTVADVFAPVVADDPGREALVTRSGRWSYAELDRLAARAAARAAPPRRRARRPRRRRAAERPRRGPRLPRRDAHRRGVGGDQPRPGAAGEAVPARRQRLVAPAVRRRDRASRWRAATRRASWWSRTARASGTTRSPPHPMRRSMPRSTRTRPRASRTRAGRPGTRRARCTASTTCCSRARCSSASRGYGPALRKGDFLPLTILNMQVLTTLLTAQAGGCSIVFDRIDAAGVAEWIRDERVDDVERPARAGPLPRRRRRGRTRRPRHRSTRCGAAAATARSRCAPRSSGSSASRCSPPTG